MASTKNETQVQFSSTNEITINNTSWNLSDPVALNVEDWDAELLMWADNQGTPASGDTVEVRVLYTNGSVDGSAGDDYVNQDNGEYMALLDTYNNDDGNGVVLSSVPLRTCPDGFKLAVKAAQGSTRNIKFRALLQTHRGAIA
jgi:hypothetical protein